MKKRQKKFKHNIIILSNILIIAIYFISYNNEIIENVVFCFESLEGLFLLS